MKHTARGAIGAAILLCVWLAGAPVQARSTAPALTSATHLMHALAMTPRTATSVDFTDWALIKQYKGVSGLTSKSPKAARLRFLLSLIKDQAAASGYNVSYAESQADLWSWDSTDLLWEASFTTHNSPPAYVLKLRDDFNLAPVIAHFVTRGFTKGDYHGVPVYTHKMDLTADWLVRSGSFSILNTAIVAHQKMLVLSPAPNAVRAILDAYGNRAPALSNDASTSAAVTRLGTIASAILMPGAGACRLFGSDPAVHLRNPIPTPLRKQIDAIKTLHPYRAFVAGYRDEGKRPVGVVVLHYAAAAVAASDLTPRRAIAANGISLTTLGPYRALFTLDNARVNGSDLALRLRPNGDRPWLLFNMVESEDMAFAGCP